MAALKATFGRLLSVDVFEVSLTALPMNEAALVTSVKTRESLATVRDFERFLRDAGFSKTEAVAVAGHG